MLDPWAIKNSAWRKRIVGWAYEYRNLRSAHCLHALADSEYRSIRAFGLKNPVAIVPNGVDIPSEEELNSNPPSSLPADWTGDTSAALLVAHSPKEGDHSVDRGVVTIGKGKGGLAVGHRWPRRNRTSSRCRRIYSFEKPRSRGRGIWTAVWERETSLVMPLECLRLAFFQRGISDCCPGGDGFSVAGFDDR